MSRRYPKYKGEITTKGQTNVDKFLTALGEAVDNTEAEDYLLAEGRQRKSERVRVKNPRWEKSKRDRLAPG